MATISIDVDPVLQRVDHMIRKINHVKRVELGQMLSAWQVDDLHRGKPFTMRSRAKGIASTRLRPHSLYEMKKGLRYQKRVKRVLARLATNKRPRRIKPLRIQAKTSMRPVLREEMDKRLEERGNELLASIRW